MTEKLTQKEAFARAMAQYAAENGPLDQIAHTVQMTSFGGSGSTALSAHLAKAGADLPKTPGEFPFKHQRFPPAADIVPTGFRVLYLFCDPRDAMLSIFRRGFIVGHYRGLHLEDPPADAAQRLQNLDTFLAGGLDDFALEDHVKRWLQPLGYPVMFLRFAALPRVWPEVREFVGLTDDVPCLELKPRASDWRSLPKGKRRALNVIYGDLVERLEALPDVQTC